MVIVSKKTATTQKGELKKGYRCVVAKNGREMYMTEIKEKEAKAGKKKMPMKKKMETEAEEKPKKTRKKKVLVTSEAD